MYSEEMTPLSFSPQYQRLIQNETGVSMRPPSATAIAAIVISVLTALAVIGMGIGYGTMDQKKCGCN